MPDELMAEQALLGACLVNAKAPMIASEYVEMSDFSRPQNAAVFDAIMRSCPAR